MFSKIPYPPLGNSFTDEEIDRIRLIFENYNNEPQSKPAKKNKPNKQKVKSVIVVSSTYPIYGKCLECGEEIAFERQLCGKFYCKNS